MLDTGTMPLVVGHGGARIHYEVLGDSGPWIVLLQGLGLSSRFWFEVPERLVSGPHRVIVLDNRGTGRSDRPGGIYRMAHMADDVVSVMDAAGADKAVVVGISMGGMIAQHVALRHAVRVSGLVLLATSPGLPHMRLPGVRTLATLLSLPLRRDRGGPGLARLLLPVAHLPRARELLSKWPAALAEAPVAARSFFAQLAAVALHTTGFRLREVRCPTVVVTGSEDLLVHPANSSVIAARIPGAFLEVLPNVGHGIPLLDEDVVMRAIQRLDAMTS